MAAISKRLLVIALCSLGLLLSQAPQAFAETYFEDFEGAGWPAANQTQTTTQTIGNFVFGWDGVGCADCSQYGYWTHSTEQAHSGSHSLKHKYPRNSPDAYSMPRIRWPKNGVNTTFSEFTSGAWFYLPATFTQTTHKFIDWRYSNGVSMNILLDASSASGAWFYIPLDEVYPQGSPDQLRYCKLYMCNANGTMRYLTKGAWHYVKVYQKLTASPAYTDTLKVWIDGEIIKFRYGAYGSDLGTPSSNVVDANISNIELSGDILTHMSWCLNVSIEGTPDNDNQIFYWDDIFLSNDFDAPNFPTGVQVHD